MDEKPTFKKTLLRKSSIIWIIGFILFVIWVLFSDLPFGIIPRLGIIVFVFLIFLYHFLNQSSLFYFLERAHYKDSQKK